MGRFSQRLSREKINDTIEKMPTLSIHKDNYFITGIPTNKDIASKTADAKYQISFKALVTRNTLPFDTHLFITYTQKAFWNVYEFSSPFRELNFNPGIGLGKPVYNKKIVWQEWRIYSWSTNLTGGIVFIPAAGIPFR